MSGSKVHDVIYFVTEARADRCSEKVQTGDGLETGRRSGARVFEHLSRKYIPLSC